MKSRRKMRRLALQILYSNEFLKEDIVSVSNRITLSLADEIDDFAKSLILKTSENKAEIDDHIERNLKDLEISRIALLDLSLMRVAVAEMLYFRDIPVEVSVNEALELSKEFISNKSSKYINGILDAILRDLEKRQLLKKDVLARLPKKMRHKNVKPTEES